MKIGMLSCTMVSRLTEEWRSVWCSRVGRFILFFTLVECQQMALVYGRFNYFFFFGAKNRMCFFLIFICLNTKGLSVKNVNSTIIQLRTHNMWKRMNSKLKPFLVRFKSPQKGVFLIKFICYLSFFFKFLNFLSTLPLKNQRI